jgi:Protein of unknown function (DUF2971)
MYPKNIYKYRCWKDEKHKRILSNNEVFFTSIKLFNDPFEATVPLRYELQSDKQIMEGYRKGLKLKYPQLNSEKIEELANDEFKKGRHRDPQHISWFRNQLINAYQKRFGIFSVSEIDNDILMWSHYSDSHKGFCVGFDFEHLNSFFDAYWDNGRFVKHHQVLYAKKYPTFTPSNMDENDLPVKPLITKSDHWCYEKEHRYILWKATNKAITLDEGIISRVILGCEMPPDHREEVIEVIRERSSKIELFQLKRKELSFGLHYEEIGY